MRDQNIFLFKPVVLACVTRLHNSTMIAQTQNCVVMILKKGLLLFLSKAEGFFFFFFYLIAVCLFDIQKCHPVGTKLLSAAGKVAKVSSEVFHFWHSESGRFWYMISFVSAPRSIF